MASEAGKVTGPMFIGVIGIVFGLIGGAVLAKYAVGPIGGGAIVGAVLGLVAGRSFKNLIVGAIGGALGGTVVHLGWADSIIHEIGRVLNIRDFGRR